MTDSKLDANVLDDFHIVVRSVGCGAQYCDDCVLRNHEQDCEQFQQLLDAEAHDIGPEVYKCNGVA